MKAFERITGDMPERMGPEDHALMSLFEGKPHLADWSFKQIFPPGELASKVGTVAGEIEGILRRAGSYRCSLHGGWPENSNGLTIMGCQLGRLSEAHQSAISELLRGAGVELPVKFSDISTGRQFGPGYDMPPPDAWMEIRHPRAFMWDLGSFKEIAMPSLLDGGFSSTFRRVKPEPSPAPAPQADEPAHAPTQGKGLVEKLVAKVGDWLSSVPSSDPTHPDRTPMIRPEMWMPWK